MGKKIINISMLQISSIVGDVEANIKKVREMVEQSLPASTDVLVLPEVWSVGWDCSKFQSSAKYYNKILDFLSNISQNFNVNIIGGSVIKSFGKKFYNTCPVFDCSGNLICEYSKMHLYSYYGCDEGKYVAAGDNPVLVELGKANFGLTICYDIRFPEIYRAYAKSGADVLVNCAAWGSKKPIQWEMMTKSRAIENQSYMVALTQSGKIKDEEYNLGQSRIIDYKGDEVCAIMSGEGFAFAKLDLEKMYEFRAKSPTLNDIRENYEVKILCKKS